MEAIRRALDRAAQSCEHVFVPTRPLRGAGACYVEGHDPARRSGCLLRVGRAARSAAAARPAGDRRRRRRAGGQLRGQTRAACGRRWAVRRPGGCARTRWWCAPRMSAYTDASRAVFAVFDDTTPLVEGLSIDEAFLDVRGLERISGTPRQIAARLRRQVRERVGLPITVGRRADEVPGEGCQRRRQARRPADRAAGGGARVPSPPARAAAVGRGARDGGEAERPRDHHGRAGRGVVGALAGRAARPRVRTPAARAGPQPRPPQGDAGCRRRSMGAQRALGRRFDPSPEALDLVLVGPRGPARAAAARGAQAVPHGHHPAALRRLLARHALAHACALDLPDADDPRDRARRCSRTRRR